MHPFLVALVICFVAVLAEVAAAGKNPRACIRSLAQPRWALPFWSWYVIGIFFYGACLVSLGLALRHDPSLGVRWRAVQLLVLLMILNPLWNVLFFRWRAFTASFWFLLPFSVVVIATVLTLAHLEGASAMAWIPYLLYLPYGCAWSYSVWKLNSGEAIRK